MAKTRIKTTPTRMQKEALSASSAVTTTNSNNVTEHVIKKRLTAFNNSLLTKEAIPAAATAAAVQSTIIVKPPKRTNSISSATSTISHTSDGNSSVESPPPAVVSLVGTPTNSNGPTMAELTENAIKTLNAGLLAKTNALALKNRKVYMITEKCDDSSLRGGSTNIQGTGGANATGSCGMNAVGGGQKRKMYLIMEEKESDVAEKLMRSECTNGSKKLTLLSDTANGHLPQKIEKILPEILNCIQAKECGGGGPSVAPVTGTINGSPAVAKAPSNKFDGQVKTQFVQQTTTINGKSTLPNDTEGISKSKMETDGHKNERLPLTLPPKKNRTKIITTQIIPVNSSTYIPATQTQIVSQTLKNVENSTPEKNITTVYCSNGNESRSGNGLHSYGRSDKISSATPVIVNANSLLTNGMNNGTKRVNDSPIMSIGGTAPPQLHKNINLSTDFLFLMKMLPKLESIPETHKNYVRTGIEDLINKFSTIDQEEDQ